MKKYSVVLLIAAVLSIGPAYAGEGRAAIASAHPLATEAGFEILAKGGNVFDAAVAVSAALAVVEPSGSGLGGGGYWLLHRASDGFETMIDGRETAPSAARRDMFTEKAGNTDERVRVDGGLSAAIPGLPAALVHLSEKYGRLPLSDSLQPAIRAAGSGFAIGERHRKLLKYRAETLKKYPQTAAIFLNGGEIPAQSWLLKQADLADTLQHLADEGRDGFYRGMVAEKLIDGVNSAGGIWTEQDLTSYRVIERTPVKGEYRGIKITSAAPPSSGGIVLTEALNVLSAYDLPNTDPLIRKHLIAEAMRRAYHDRALYLGDPDYTDIPVKRLLSEDYAAGLRASLRLDKALPSTMLSGDFRPRHEGNNTTHFSIIDEQGNRVAATLSINLPFGAAFVAPGTGVLLNDHMDDFAAAPGVMNAYGLIGSEANLIAPGKRMLSSMTPTFLEQGDRVAVLGTPGGSRIISMVLLAALDFADGNGPESWVKVPRFHHQFMPDVLEYEPGALTEENIQGLQALGYTVKQARYRYGNMQAVLWNKSSHGLAAASDPRGEGKALVGN